MEKPGSWAFTTILAVVVGLWTALFARFIDPLAIPEASKTPADTIQRMQLYVYR